MKLKDQKVIKIYERYVEEENEENDMNKILPAGGEVKVDEKMGYVSQLLKMLARVLRISLRII